MTFMFAWESSLMLWIQNHLRCGFFNPIITTITHLGDGGVFWILLTLALLLFKKTRKVGLSCALSMVIGLIFTNLILKNWIARVRPYELIDGLTILVSKPHDWSFPSGHTTNSLAAALVMFHLLPRKYGIPALVLAIVIALSRLYVGVHYPTDVLGGALIAAVAAWCACRFHDKKLARPIK